MTEDVAETTFIARLWEYPTLCIGLFGVQFQTADGQCLYNTNGIGEELAATLAARPDGLLHTRHLMSREGPLIMVYWRSYGDLDRWAQSQSHARWWRWLIENTGQGVVFYHEVYQARAAEAVYEPCAQPVGLRAIL